LNGRIVVWWSEDPPRLIRWGDRGYRNVREFPRSTDRSEIEGLLS
jgi:hypothetical protein